MNRCGCVLKKQIGLREYTVILNAPIVGVSLNTARAEILASRGVCAEDIADIISEAAAYETPHPVLDAGRVPLTPDWVD